jgi:hypothetical protein
MSMPGWFRCALLVGFALTAARPASAISIVEPIAFGSWRVEPETGSIGAGAAVGILSIDGVGMIEHVFTDHSNDWAVTLDGHFPVLALPLVAFYIGAGFTSYHFDPDQGEADWDTGLNALIGTKMSIKRLKPFAEIKYTTQGQDGYVFTLGTRFHLFD